jgi:phosphatidylserine/phosphatidylglycerophosphate/cardiolipin synthase-like enzyme
MMMRTFIRTVTLWAFILHGAFAQKTCIEKEYTLSYTLQTITWTFTSTASKATIIKAVDIKNNELIPFHKVSNHYLFDATKPAQIIKVDYTLDSLDGSNMRHAMLATPSLSTGSIHVYFNHEVNTSYSQVQNAVNMGSTLADLLISYINACENTLDIAIYNSYSPSETTGIVGAINAAYTRGVQVRVIYDGSTSSAMIPLLNVNIPRLASPSSSSYGIMHNKFVLFDADHIDPNKPYVWTGSTNWTTSQIDGPDRNSVILIQDQALAQGYKIEFEEMWGSSTATPDSTLSKFGPYKTDNTPHHYLIGGITIDQYFSPSDGVNAKIIDAINSASTDIDIATMVLTRTDISSALISKYNSGLASVNVVTDTQNPSGNQFSILQSGLLAGHVVKFTNSGVMHHKFMVVDNFNSTSDPLVLLGSHNWSSAAETKNDENTLVVHDLNIANQYYQAFAYLYLDALGTLNNPETEVISNAISLYPNPITDKVTIATTRPYTDVTLSLYDTSGKCIQRNHYDTLLQENIILNSPVSGLYFVQVQGPNLYWTSKLIKL